MTVTSEVVALCIAIVSLKPEDKPVRAPPLRGFILDTL